MWLVIVPIVMFGALILATIFAGVFWVLGAGWPWLLIGLGMWLLWRGDGRHHRARRHRAAWDTHSRHTPAANRPDEPVKHQRAPTHASAATQRGPAELPIDVQVKVEQIRRKVDVLLGYADRFPPFSQDLYLVRQTASDYLPRTIETYLKMTRETAEKPLGPHGKTAHEELKAQLDLLDARLDDIAQDLERQDTDRLLANRRFLEQRFGMRERVPVLDGGAQATG
ncbi:MAG: hypothetical protein LC797_13190 [Chloroflexi bacterium]|nr:hypothetical protein [Chloroflexota bacterium]